MRPQQIRFCTTSDGVRLAYALIGSGPAIVKVGSWLTHLEFELESPIWRHWITEFSRDHTLIRYDVRGCGLSDRDVEDVSLKAWVRDLATVLDAAGIQRCALFGLSQGGAIAAAYAAMHPERVSHLVLYGAYARGVGKREWPQERLDEAEAMVQLTATGWGQDNPACRQLFTTLHLPDGDLAQFRAFNELQRASTSPANAVRFLRALHAIDVQDLARRVRCPSLVLHVHGDARVPFEEGRRFASLLQDAQFVPLPGRNHILVERDPAWLVFVREVRRFLDRTHGNTTLSTLAPLSARERDVLELLARGFDNHEIAAKLDRSEKTIRNHVTSIFSKIGVSTRAQAIVQAREAGFGR